MFRLRLDEDNTDGKLGPICGQNEPQSGICMKPKTYLVAAARTVV